MPTGRESAAVGCGLRGAWAHWYRRILPAYWLFLFCLTHFPKLEVGTRVPKSDKIAHLVAFGLLAFLFWRFRETLGQPGTSFVWVAGVVLAVYAVIDEYTQGWVGRGVEGADLLANLTGIVVMLAVLEWRRRAAKRAT